MATQPQHISIMDVSRAVSLVTGLPPELQEIVNLSGRVHSRIASDSSLRMANFGPESIKSLIYSSMSAEVLELLDPAKRAEAQRIQAQNANTTSAQTAAAGTTGRFINGVWVENTKGESALSTRGGNQFTDLKGVKANASEIAPGTGYSWLSPANQNIPGFTQAQVASSANFLKNAGLSREDVNHDTRHMVHLAPYQREIGGFIGRQREIDQRRARGENVDDAQKKLDEDKRNTRGRMTPEQQKHFDQLKAIRAQDKKRVELEGEHRATLSDSQALLSSEVSQLGITGEIIREHKATVAQVVADPTATDDLKALLAGHPAQLATRTTDHVKPASNPAATAKHAGGPQKANDPAATQQRHAVNAKALNPSA
jgi:hypothetical protein